jgi:hypothetical protein
VNGFEIYFEVEIAGLVDRLDMGSKINRDQNLH